MKTSYDRLAKIYTNCYGHMTKMATTHIYSKKPFKDLLWNQKLNGLVNRYVVLEMLALPGLLK